MKSFLLMLALCLISVSAFAKDPSVVGEVTTSKGYLGPDDTIGVARFDDPQIANASCYLSSAQKGGFEANFGLQEDNSEYTLDCFARGPIQVSENIPVKQVISETKRSLIFKKMYVVRFVDRQAGRLIYVAYTRYMDDGSPSHAMSSVSYK